MFSLRLFLRPTVLFAVLAISACSQDNLSIQEQRTRAETKAIRLTLLHMNDHHSHLEADSFTYPVDGIPLKTTMADGRAIERVHIPFGGFPMLVSLFDQLESEATHVLKLHSGDAITGTLYYSLFKGAADAEMMNQICFDAFALGNHEFDDGDIGLASFLDHLNRSEQCQTPILAANVVPGHESVLRQKDYIQPYIIKEFDGEKVGLIGIDIAHKTKESSNPDPSTTFLNETETAQQVIDELLASGINKIILLTHYQYKNDLILAKSLRGVDIIIGGDSHSLLGDDTFTTLGFDVEGDYPTRLENADGNTVCVVQAWEYAYVLGKLEVSFDEQGHVTQCQGHPFLPINAHSVSYHDGKQQQPLLGEDLDQLIHHLTREDEIIAVQPDKVTQALLDHSNQQVERLQQQVIGNVSETLCLERFPGQGKSSTCELMKTYHQGSDISNIVAKAFLMETATADIALVNAGGVRVDVLSGDFTIADAFSLLPFSNTLGTVEVTGADIVRVLEAALDNALNPNGSTGSYPYASGLRFDVDISQKRGRRIRHVEINPRLSGTWQAIQLNKTYILVTSNYLAAGNDGYDFFAELTFSDSFKEYSQGFIDYVSALTEQGEPLQPLPKAEYSTQSFINKKRCHHQKSTHCTHSG